MVHTIQGLPLLLLAIFILLILIISLQLIIIFLPALLLWILLQLKFALSSLAQRLVELRWKLQLLVLLYFFTHFHGLSPCCWLHVHIFIQHNRGLLMLLQVSSRSLKEAGHSCWQFQLAKIARERLVSPHLSLILQIVEQRVDPIKCRLLMILDLYHIGHIFDLNLMSKLQILPPQLLYLVGKLVVGAIVKREASLQLRHLSILLIVAGQFGLIVRNRSQVGAFHPPSYYFNNKSYFGIIHSSQTEGKQQNATSRLFYLYLQTKSGNKLTVDLKMNITPTKQEGSNRKEIKKTGKRVAAEEQPEEPSSQGFKVRPRTIVIIAVCSLLLIAAITVPLVLLIQKSNATQVVYLDEGIMQVPIKSGGSFESRPIQVSAKGKKVELTRNRVLRNGRQAQEAPADSGRISYYHKDTQISVSFDSQLKAQIRIPGDTGLDFLLNNAPLQSQSTLERLPQELPMALEKELEEKTGLQMTVTTQISYDGVYNSETNEYRLLTQQKSFHPEQFAKITSEERDLCDPKPAITNFNDISDVTGTIAKAVSTITVNTIKVVEENKLKPQSGAKEGPEVNRCVRVGQEVLRCSEEVWRSGQLKVSNLQDPNPLQVWEIVVTSE